MKNKLNAAAAGNQGEKIRSDCFIQVELTISKGINIELNSKVKTLWGKSIIGLVLDIFKYFEISDANVLIEDYGALPYVISARAEAAIKKIIETDKEYLVEFIKENNYKTSRERNRISRLYLPGNTPGLMINAGI